jgi:hypothetical protein
MHLLGDLLQIFVRRAKNQYIWLGFRESLLLKELKVWIRFRNFELHLLYI